MIADDEPFIREGIEQLIPWRNLGCELIYSAQNGRELIEQIQQEKPDIIIVDIKMPLMGGLDVAKWIQEKNLNIKIIILTAFTDFQYAHMAIKYNVSDYIIKTSAIEDIPNSIADITKKLQESKLVSYRLILFYGATKESGVEKIIETVFSKQYRVEFQNQLKEKCIIISGSDVEEASVIYDCNKKFQGLYNNFLHKDITIGISPVYYDRNQAYEHYERTLQYVKRKYKENISDIFFQKEEDNTNQDNHFSENMSELLRNVGLYIKDNYCSKITLDDVAQASHVNPSYLSRIYKQKTGSNLFDTINMKRIKKAKEYICNQELKMYEIAELVGFEDTAYFSKVFKKYEGLSPKEYYRKICMEAEDEGLYGKTQKQT